MLILRSTKATYETWKNSEDVYYAKADKYREWSKLEEDEHVGVEVGQILFIGATLLILVSLNKMVFTLQAKDQWIPVLRNGTCYSIGGVA